MENLSDIEFPKPVKPPKIKIPDKISLKEIKALTSALEAVRKEVSKQRVNDRVTIENRNEIDAIPVVLTDKTRRKFYNVIATAIGSYAKYSPFATSDGTNREALVNSDGSIVMDEKETTNFEGGPVTVGTTAVEVTFASKTQSIGIQSDHDNSGTIWLGGSTVDNTGANAVRRLEAGESYEMDLNDASAPLYAVSDTASQKIFKIALI